MEVSGIRQLWRSVIHGGERGQWYTAELLVLNYLCCYCYIVLTQRETLGVKDVGG